MVAAAALDNANLRGLIDCSPDCIALFGLDGRLQFLNRAAISLMEVVDFEAIRGQPWRALWPRQAHPAIDAAIASALRSEPSRFEAHARTGRGAMKSWEVVVAPILASGGGPTALMATARDVTDAFLARRAAEARDLDRARTDTMIRSASRIAQLGGWSFDCATQQVTFTSELATLLGSNHTVDHQVALQRWAPEDRAPFDAALQEAAARGLEFSYEGRIQAPDGGWRWVKVIGEPELENGWCVALRGATLDVTEWRETLDRVRASEQAALRSAEAMSGFLATMGHELRTPLNGVLGMAQAMRRGELSDQQQERLGLIETSGQALLGLLDDLLDLTKIGAGEIVLEDGVIDTAVLAQGAASLALLAESRPVTLAVEVTARAEGRWSGDPNRVRQVLHNLVGNGLKFTERGSVTVAIDHDGERLVLRVGDTGIGIAEDQLAAIFDRFAQADGSRTRRHGGAGLGLAICRDLVTLMGGDISVESTPGNGAIFTARVPAQPISAASALVADTPADAAQDLRVLAAEDNAANRLVLKTLLGELGIEPVIVDDGAAAVDAWRQGAWDVILMDIQMPVMDGVGATRAIRASERAEALPRTPIIALTANAMAHQRAEYLAVGMDDVVAKPIDLMVLLNAIDAALNPSGIEAKASA